MSDDTTPQDGKAMSPASAGSVAEIARLRSKLRLQDAVIRSGAALTLTSEEQDAIEGAIGFLESRGVWAWPATLRELLERTK